MALEGEFRLLQGIRQSAVRRGLLTALGAMVLALAASIPTLYEQWRELAYVNLAVELKASVPVRVKLFHDSGSGWSGSGNTWTMVPEGSGFHLYRFVVPVGRVRTLALGVGRPDAILEIREARLEPAMSMASALLPEIRLPSATTQGPSTPEELPVIPPPPAGVSLLVLDLATPIASEPREAAALGSTAVEAAPRLLVLTIAFALLLSFGQRLLTRLWRFALSHRGRVAMLASASTLILALAAVSRFDAHPDEAFHEVAASYYDERWLPPAVSDPALTSYLHPLYGVSYLQTTPPQIAYMLGTKVTRLFAPPSARLGTSLRLFAWSMFVLMVLAVAIQPAADPAYALTLLLTPQIWYVFSYFNGDALPFAAAFLVACELGFSRSSTRRFFEEPLNGYRSWRAFPLGVLLGILLLSKLNYYIFLAFVAGYAIWHVATTAPSSRRGRLARWGAIAAVASVVATPFLITDLVRNGPGKAAAVEALRETHAAPAFKPSEIHNNASYPGLALRDRGVSIVTMFREMRWHVTMFQSFAGLYGYASIVATPLLYAVQGALLLALATGFIWTIYRNISRRTLPVVILAALTIVVGLGASIYHSWTFDFQPQGRYLFPILPALLITWRTVASNHCSRSIALLAFSNWAVSLISFTTVAITIIQK